VRRACPDRTRRRQVSKGLVTAAVAAAAAGAATWVFAPRRAGAAELGALARGLPHDAALVASAAVAEAEAPPIGPQPVVKVCARPDTTVARAHASGSE
jgi:hypothetical protein